LSRAPNLGLARSGGRQLIEIVGNWHGVLVACTLKTRVSYEDEEEEEEEEEEAEEEEKRKKTKKKKKKSSCN